MKLNWVLSWKQFDSFCMLLSSFSISFLLPVQYCLSSSEFWLFPGKLFSYPSEVDPQEFLPGYSDTKKVYI